MGANGSGKSTLLRGMSRLLPPTSGGVMLDGRELRSLRGKELARRLGLLPQSPLAPDGVTVRELVSRGRFPHQGLIPQWSAQDEQAVAEALAATRTDALQERLLEELSGGQRQRVWIAMALAQQTEVLLLDEPTTFLDVTHQLEVLDVVRDLNRERGTTVGIVLHDLNLAARYADHLVAVRGGEIHSQGSPSEVITAQMAHDVFALDAHIAPDPVTGSPMVLPRGRDRTASPHPHHHEEDPVSTTTETATSRETALVPALEHSSMLAFELTVAARRALGPSLVRFTFTSADLEHFGTNSHPLDLRVKLIIPGPEASADHFAPVRPDGHAGPCRPRRVVSQLVADRSRRPRLDAHLHRARAACRRPSRQPLRTPGDRHRRGAPSGPHRACRARGSRRAGPGTRRWGTPSRLLGPNRHLVGPDYGGIEFRPGTARTVLLVGDETAVPAIGSILEALPASISGHALLEVPEAGDAQQLLTRSGVQVTWLPREGRPHGELLDAAVRSLMSENAQAFRDAAADGPEAADGTDAALREELEDVDVDETILWETTTGHGAFYAWLAGEAGLIKTLRRHLVSELGLDRKQVSFMGYWRQGRPEN